jgi:hypothetical protein
MLCCLLATLAMLGAGLARWRRLIGGALAALLLTGAGSALAWTLAAPHGHAAHSLPFTPLWCGQKPANLD